MLGKVGGAFPGFQNLLRRVAVWIARLQGTQDELAVAGDDGQQIIEIVRHAAGQHPDSLHFLRLTKLVFKLAASGDVAEHHQVRRQAAEMGVVQGHFYVDDAAGAGAMPPQIARCRAALFTDQNLIQTHTPELIPRMSIQTGRRLVRFQDLPLHGVNHPHGLRMFFKQKLEFAVFWSQQLFRRHELMSPNSWWLDTYRQHIGFTPARSMTAR